MKNFCQMLIILCLIFRFIWLNYEIFDKAPDTSPRTALAVLLMIYFMFGTFVALLIGAGTFTGLL